VIEESGLEKLKFTKVSSLNESLLVEAILCDG